MTVVSIELKDALRRIDALEYELETERRTVKELTAARAENERLQRVLREISNSQNVTPGGHYSVNFVAENDAWRVLHGTFGDSGEVADYSANWLFLSTSGVHGWYTTLADIEGKLDEEPYITFLILAPRLCRIAYGNVPINDANDITWLEQVVGQSLKGIMASQEGNVP